MNQDYITDKSYYRLYYGESINDEGACSSNSHIIKEEEKEKENQHIEIDFKNELIENSKSTNTTDKIESISINYDNLQSPPNIEQQEKPQIDTIEHKKKKKRMSNIKWWKSKFINRNKKEICINNKYNNGQDETTITSLDNLSNELLVLIYSYLDPESLGRLSMISKRLNLVSYDSLIWKYVIRNWQCNTISKLKKKIYSKKPSQLVNRILVPPLILDDNGEVVHGPLPPYDSVIAHQLTRLNTTMETANAINEFISAQLNNSESSDFQDNDKNNTIPKLRNFSNNNKQLAIQQKPKKLKTENNIIVLKKLNTTNGNGDNGTKKEIKTKEYYIRSYIKIKEELENRENIVKVQEKHQKRLNDISITSKIMFYSFFSRPSEWISVLFLILFTVFVGLKLDGYLVNTSWVMVFIPMMLLMFQFLITPLIFVFFKTIFGHSYEEELSPDSFIKPLFFSLFFIIPLQPGQKIYTIILFTPIFCMLSFIVLLICRLQMVSHALSWTLVFSPLFLFCLYVLGLVSIFPERIDTSIKTLDLIAMVSCSFFFSVFILLLYLNVGNIVELDWYIVFTPLFVIKLIAICYPIMIRVLHCSRYATKLIKTSGWFKESNSLTMVILFFFLLSCPLAVFEILLIQNLNYNNITVFKYTIVLVPIFFIEFLMVCGCFFINLAFGHRNQN